MNKINLYFRKQPTGYKFIPGDRYFINLCRKLFGLKKTSGVEKVFVNLCKGFDLLNIKYNINPHFDKIKPDEPVVVLGVGRYALKGYTKTNPVIAGIGLMTHPSEWPDLFKSYPVARYLQHADWANNIYKPYYGNNNCLTWPAGIDTDKWAPLTNTVKKYDILIYNKIMWDKTSQQKELKQPILNMLTDMGISYQEIDYGSYNEAEYHTLLQQCRAMVFLCEHESQGFACCEALSMNVPVFAWDQGYWLDPNRFAWNDPVVKATSVPFFDDDCGMRFVDFTDFKNSFGFFWNKVKLGSFNPRKYILNNLTLEKSAEKMIDIIQSVYGS